jgi:ParB family transcriptional regulator, chromosome partitioning protein
VQAIDANPSQPRRRFDEPSLAALAESIRQRGVLQPVIVRPVGDRFELVAGERRWRACQLAGQTVVPALIDPGIDDAGSLELALIENLVREDLSPIEQARTFSVLLDDLQMTAGLLASRVGRSRPDVANTVRLLELPDEAIDLIDTGKLSKGHGKALLAEPDHHRRRQLARRAVAHSWSVRELEAAIARDQTPRQQRRQPGADQCAVAARLQDTIARAIGQEAKAVAHRDGFQILLDAPAAARLQQILGGEIAGL